MRLCRLMCGSAPRFRPLLMVSGLRPKKSGRSPKPNCVSPERPKAFRTSDGIAGDAFGKARGNYARIDDLVGSCRYIPKTI